MTPAFSSISAWLDRVDPGTHRRIKGLRLVTAYGIAAMLGVMPAITATLPDHAPLASLAGNFALWGSVSEARFTRTASSRDLALLMIAAVAGASGTVLLTPLLQPLGHAGPEAALAIGAFCVGFLRRYGVTGTGIGSQIYIGQLLAFNAALTPSDLPAVALAGGLAAVGSIVPRLLSGPSEHPPLLAPGPVRAGWIGPEVAMGLQAATAALVIVALNAVTGLLESAWAITACTYVVAGSASGTLNRVRRRIVGTMVGVPLGLAFLPLVNAAPLLVWIAAALAMIVYAMALPDRYDVACGAFAFTLVVTLAIGGEHTIAVLAARAWETLLGGALGAAAATLLFPLRPAPGRSGEAP